VVLGKTAIKTKITKAKNTPKDLKSRNLFRSVKKYFLGFIFLIRTCILYQEYQRKNNKSVDNPLAIN